MNKSERAAMNRADRSASIACTAGYALLAMLLLCFEVFATEVVEPVQRVQLYNGDTLLLGAKPKLQRRSGDISELEGTQRAVDGFAAATAPDGAVILFGGRNARGVVIGALDALWPAGTIRPLATNLLVPRMQHTATLLTDGRVLIAGGMDGSQALVPTVELFDTVTGEIKAGPALQMPRRGHTARLLASGRVLIEGGIGEHGETPSVAELFDPITGVISVYDDVLQAQDNALASAPTVTQILPPHEARGVGVEEYIAVRFSRPTRAASVLNEGITVIGPDGAIPGICVPAEDGMLAFLLPAQNLLPDSHYSVFVQEVFDKEGNAFPLAASSFTTGRLVSSAASSVGSTTNFIPAAPPNVPQAAKASFPIPPPSSDPEIWTPDRDAIERGLWQDRRTFPNRSLDALPKAPEGVTAIAGYVLRLDGQPLADVSLKAGGVQVTTDKDGAFLLAGITAGYFTLEINGATASHGANQYGRYLARVKAVEGQTTNLPFTIWMTKLDPRGTMKISSPTTAEVVATTPTIPGLEIHIPAGTVIRDLDGKIVTEINVTAVPVNRPAFPLPDFPIPVFFTVQPGGAGLQAIDAQTLKGARVYYPNYHNSAPGSRFPFYNYDPYSKEWYSYGEGETSKDGTQVIPDAGVAVYQFTGAMFNNGSNTAPPKGPPVCSGGGGASGGGCGSGAPNSDSSGDPVSTSTGYFIHAERDLYVHDVVPIDLTRYYRSQDAGVRTFGLAWTTVYDTLLYSQNQWQEVDLILPDGGRVHFARTSAGTTFNDAIFQSTSPGKWHSAMIYRNNDRSGWDLIFRDGTKWFFPQFGLLAEMTDPNGNTTTIFRNGGTSGPITRIESPNGRYINFTLDSNNRIVQATDNAGRTYSYGYDAAGKLITVTDPALNQRSYSWGSGNKLLSITDARGNVSITNQYDANGRVTLQTLADGNTFQYAYTLDAAGQVVQTNVTDARGKVRHIEFDSNGYIIKSVAAYGTTQAQETTFMRATNGQITNILDPLGRATAYTYDNFGNVASQTRLAGTPDATTTSYTYTPGGGHLAGITDPLNHQTNFVFDANGNLNSVTDPLGHTTSYARDFRGRVTSVTDPLSHVWTYTYSGADLAAITDPLGRAVQYFTDAAGRVIFSRDAAGNIRSFEYDAMNRLTKTIEPLGSAVQLTYDAHGNLTAHADEKNNSTTYAYNSRNLIQASTDALAHSSTYTYSPNGRISQVTDRKGQLSAFSYDDLERLSQIGFGANTGNPTAFSSTITYTYDAANRITQIADSTGGPITRTYDPLDRLTQEQTPAGTVSYTYDAAGRRSTMTVAGELPIAYAWDNASRLTSITQGADVVSFTYDNANRRTSATLANGVVMSYDYDTANQVTSITYTKGATTLGDLQYTYDIAGRRVAVGGSLSIVDLPAAVSVGSVNANNQIAAWAGATLTYDLNGNLTADGARTYVWDERNRLASISGDITATFGYDGLGRRRTKTVNGTQTDFVYDGLNFVQERTGGAPTANLITGGIDELFARHEGATATSYPITDALGSVIGLTDAAGALQAQLSYEPYGKSSGIGATTNNSQTYTAREDDAASLMYYRARYYSPVLGRFVAEDPAGFAAGSNIYAYVENDPINATDPLGLQRINAPPVYSNEGFPGKPPYPNPGFGDNPRPGFGGLSGSAWDEFPDYSPGQSQCNFGFLVPCPPKPIYPMKKCWQECDPPNVCTKNWGTGVSRANPACRTVCSFGPFAEGP